MDILSFFAPILFYISVDRDYFALAGDQNCSSKSRILRNKYSIRIN